MGLSLISSLLCTLPTRTWHCTFPSAAAQWIIIFAGIAYITLWLTFGGSPTPPTWCAFSEMVTNLSNKIALCKEWDHMKLQSPAQLITPTPIMLPDSVPIVQAKPTAVGIPTTIPRYHSPRIRMSPRSAPWERRVNWMMGFGCASVALTGAARLGWVCGLSRTADGVNALAARANNLSLILLWRQMWYLLSYIPMHNGDWMAHRNE
jgi:hypothetical protein